MKSHLTTLTLLITTSLISCTHVEEIEIETPAPVISETEKLTESHDILEAYKKRLAEMTMAELDNHILETGHMMAELETLESEKEKIVNAVDREFRATEKMVGGDRSNARAEALLKVTRAEAERQAVSHKLRELASRFGLIRQEYKKRLLEADPLD